MNRAALTICLLVLCAAPMRAQHLYAYRDSVKDGYNFLLYQPAGADTSRQELPLILFLHGKSLSGTDLNQVLRYGTIDAVKRGLPLEAVVVAPQTEIVGWNVDRLGRVVDYVTDKYLVDTNRFYVIGMSMGGWGTLKMVHRYPDRMAALAMCGGYEEPSISGLSEVPLWIIHGFRDTVTRVSYSADLVKKMYDSGQGERLIFDQPACGHSELARVFYLPELYDWLFEHNLQDKMRPVNLGYTITEKKMNAAYNNLDPDRALSLTPKRPPYIPSRRKELEQPLPEIKSWKDLPSLIDYNWEKGPKPAYGSLGWILR